MAKELIQKVGRTEGLSSLLCPKFLRLPRPERAVPGSLTPTPHPQLGSYGKEATRKKTLPREEGGAGHSPPTGEGPLRGRTGGPRGQSGVPPHR